MSLLLLSSSEDIVNEENLSCLQSDNTKLSQEELRLKLQLKNIEEQQAILLELKEELKEMERFAINFQDKMKRSDWIGLIEGGKSKLSFGYAIVKSSDLVEKKEEEASYKIENAKSNE